MSSQAALRSPRSLCGAQQLFVRPRPSQAAPLRFSNCLRRRLVDVAVFGARRLGPGRTGGPPICHTEKGGGSLPRCSARLALGQSPTAAALSARPRRARAHKGGLCSPDPSSGCLRSSPLNQKKLRSGEERRLLSSPLSPPAGQHGRIRDPASQLKPRWTAPASAAILIRWPYQVAASA
ncbi:hypothetical protein NDU88_005340 [Pleurodeles waltl]|uniref:Uncharacterized protein n=1 Tax=Pleurodeles waltl TaxID=8319 RepID=A0AAV7WBL3_PLEWA|nr:hypothetical protein NDU88_005340 [Pleurodeles waltl]